MSALEKVRCSRGEFEYPEALPERLGWFTREAGVGNYHILRLMGLSCSVARALAATGAIWSAVVADAEEAAWWAEGMLYDALAVFDYDAAEMRRRLGQPARGDYLVPLPGGGAVPIEDLPPPKREEAWLGLLAQGGRVALPALIAYLSRPAEALGSA